MLRHVAEVSTGVAEAEPVISLPLALPRRPALDGRSFPNQRNRSAKVGFVDLGGVGLDFEEKISYGHLAPFKLVMERYTGSYQWKPAPIARGIMYKIEHWESVSPVLMTRPDVGPEKYPMIRI